MNSMPKIMRVNLRSNSYRQLKTNTDKIYVYANLILEGHVRCQHVKKWQNAGLKLPRAVHLILGSMTTGYGIPTLWIFKDQS